MLVRWTTLCMQPPFCGLFSPPELFAHISAIWPKPKVPHRSQYWTFPLDRGLWVSNLIYSLPIQNVPLKDGDSLSAALLRYHQSCFWFLKYMSEKINIKFHKPAKLCYSLPRLRRLPVIPHGLILRWTFHLCITWAHLYGWFGDNQSSDSSSNPLLLSGRS